MPDRVSLLEDPQLRPFLPLLYVGLGRRRSRPHRARCAAETDRGGALGDLYALCRIEENLAWYLGDGFVEAGKARAIRKEVEKVLQENMPMTRALVDGFGIPDACPAAPIAFFDPAQ